MKTIFSICLLVASLLVQAQKEKPDSNFHVYLLIGQSNMAGRGPLDAESKKTDTHILMLDSQNRWVPATDPVHFDKPASVGVGPAISFAKEMTDGNRNIKIGLVPCALGGSPIKVWQPGAVYLTVFHPYEDAIARARLAMKKGVLKGILWHQGESDNDPVHAAVYLEKLKALIHRLRTDLQQPEIPFVAGEIGYFNKSNDINSIINGLPEQVPHTAVVSAKGLTDKGDHIHFDTPSARELGKRYAEAMKGLQLAGNGVKPSEYAREKKLPVKQPIVVLTFDDAVSSHYSVVAPLLKKYHFGATFFVCEYPRESPSDSIDFMKWPQISELHKMGFEIGNHTGHHKNVTKLNREQIKEEISYIETKCREYGIPKPISFAYPGNRFDSLSQVVLEEMGYRYARAGGSRFYDPLQDKRLVIPSYTMTSGDKLRERVMNALKEVKPGQILVFCIHGVPYLSNPDYSTTPEHFTEYLQYMHDHHFKVIAVRDLEKYMGSDLP